MKRIDCGATAVLAEAMLTACELKAPAIVNFHTVLRAELVRFGAIGGAPAHMTKANSALRSAMALFRSGNATKVGSEGRSISGARAF
jgi:hypothetical protein